MAVELVFLDEAFVVGLNKECVGLPVDDDRLDFEVGRDAFQALNQIGNRWTVRPHCLIGVHPV